MLITILWAFTVLLLLAVLLPLSKLPIGVIRGLEFIRIQFVVIALALACVVFLFMPTWLGGYGGPFLLVLAATHSLYIAKFTPLWKKQSVTASPSLAGDAARRISVLAANVKKSNRQYEPLIQLVHGQAPDIVLAIEVDQEWIDALKAGLVSAYDHWIDVPKDNGYGICILSRLPLRDVEIRDLITDDVPSVRVKIHLRSGQSCRLYVVHPEPPVVNHDTKGRDSEIALVGMEAAADDLPTIVAGDLNDVAWSTTTRRFQRLSGLLDPRVGRGFYNTFSATMPWMRWPLDHLFHDPSFRLIEMARLPKIGSDHFPMWFVLALAQTEEKNSSPGARDADEAVAAKRMIVEERKRSRDPIGADWEDE